MKTLLRQINGGLYIQSPDKWTQDPDQALDFRFIDRAVRFTETWELKEVELVLVLDNPRRMTAIPLEKCKVGSGR